MRGGTFFYDGATGILPCATSIFDLRKMWTTAAERIFAVAADLAATARCLAASCIRALVTNVSGARLTVRLG